MEAIKQTEQKQRTPIPKINGRVVNGLLLCRKHEIEEKTVGGIYLTSEGGEVDLRDSVQKKAEVVLVSKKLFPEEDDFEVGDILVYPKGTREMVIWIDGNEYFILYKREMVYVEK